MTEKVKEILICESDVDLLFKIKDLIEESIPNSATTLCENALMAIEQMIVDDQFDLIISNNDMEKENGDGKDLFTFTEENRYDIPFILYTQESKHIINIENKRFYYVDKNKCTIEDISKLAFKILDKNSPRKGDFLQ